MSFVDCKIIEDKIKDYLLTLDLTKHQCWYWDFTVFDSDEILNIEKNVDRFCKEIDCDFYMAPMHLNPGYYVLHVNAKK